MSQASRHPGEAARQLSPDIPGHAGQVRHAREIETHEAMIGLAIGLAIDRGVAARDTGALLTWTLAMLGVGVLQAVSGVMRHRFAVTNWLTAAYRTVQLVGRQAVHLGATLPRRVATGEVVAIGTNDLAHLGNAMDVLARAAGAVVSFLVVAVILLRTSVTLGLVVLLGVPLLLLAVGPLLKPLQRRNLAQREMMGDLSNLATDIVSGLRVLRGEGDAATVHDLTLPAIGSTVAVRYLPDSPRQAVIARLVRHVEEGVSVLEIEGRDRHAR